MVWGVLFRIPTNGKGTTSKMVYGVFYLGHQQMKFKITQKMAYECFLLQD
jgi:hypothetical protein